MKRIKYAIVLAVSLIFSLVGCSTDHSVYSPPEPVPGEELSITVDKSDTTLINRESLSVIIYSVKNGTINAVEQPLTKNEDAVWGCKYNIPDSSQCLGLRFIAGGAEFQEANQAKVYTVKLFGSNGGQVEGGKAAEAFMMVFLSSGYPKESSRDAYQLFKDEFSTNPEYGEYYIRQFCNLVNSEEPDSAGAIILKFLSGVEKDKDTLEENKLISIKDMCGYYLQDTEKVQYWNNFITERFPKGKLNRNELTKKFYSETDPAKAEVLFNEYAAGYSDADAYDNSSSYISMAGAELNGYLKAGKTKEAERFFKSLNISSNYKKWMWGYGVIARAVQYLLDNSKDIAFAEELNDVSIKLAEELIHSSKPVPNWLTERQYQEMTKEFASYNYVAAGKLYEKTKGPAEALKIVEEGYKLSDFHSELKEYYLKLLVENNRAEDALKIADEAIIAGKGSETILAVHKSAYSMIHGSDEGYEDYLAKLKGQFVDSYIAKVKKSIINEQAPAFTLKDLDGKDVSLSDYKGKTVILDFWATWCSPCKASFPSMEKAIHKYADNKDVVFLFVNTMEKTGKPGANASKFIKAKGYPFHVLVDADSKISASYDVLGIPTKIFIDKTGNIRYRSIGFEGEEILLKEIDTIVDVIK